MILDLDIYRSANLLVKRHGPDAPTRPPCGRMLPAFTSSKPFVATT